MERSPEGEAERRGRARDAARLSLAAQDTGQCPGTADAIFVLEGGLIVCAGSAATTVREAVDRLEARLRHRLLSLTRSEERHVRRDTPIAAE